MKEKKNEIAQFLSKQKSQEQTDTTRTHKHNTHKDRRTDGRRDKVTDGETGGMEVKSQKERQ